MDRPKRGFWEMRAGLPPGPIFGPPLVPSESDIGFYESCAASAAAELAHRAMRVLMLGVTRPIAEMRWPKSASLLAVDWSMGMIRRTWSGQPSPGRRAAVLADWRELPLPAGTVDLAVGDGCYAALDSFAEGAAVNAEIRRILRPGGWFIQRCFVRPDPPEPVDAIFAALNEGTIRSFDSFCLRLAMALHDAQKLGTRVDDVWKMWISRVPSHRELFARMRWQDRSVGLIERWRGIEARMPMPTLAELRALVEPWFEVAACTFADYEMGDRCARIALRARA